MQLDLVPRKSKLMGGSRTTSMRTVVALPCSLIKTWDQNKNISAPGRIQSYAMMKMAVYLHF